MCTFTSELPSSERPATQKAFISLFLRPNDPNNPKEVYRFRLLNFRLASKNDRKYPFISRYVHNHWGIGNDGQHRVVDECVVCPSSPYIDARNDAELGFADTFKELKLRNIKPTKDTYCPLCHHEAEAWNAYKNSGKTDKLASQRALSMKSQFQGIVPVYVVSDPLNTTNNGRLKCVIFNNKEDYDKFLDIVRVQIKTLEGNGNPFSWCNGENAVDFYIRVDNVPFERNPSKTERRFTRMYFGQKPYSIVNRSGESIITKEAIDRFEFDDQFYVKNTKSELEAFYKKYFALAAANVPDEDIDVIGQVPPLVAAPQQSKPRQTVQNTAAKPAAVPSEELDDLLSDSDDLPPPTPPAEEHADQPPQEDVPSINDVLAEFKFTD